MGVSGMGLPVLVCVAVLVGVCCAQDDPYWKNSAGVEYDIASMGSPVSDYVITHPSSSAQYFININHEVVHDKCPAGAGVCRTDLDGEFLDVAGNFTDPHLSDHPLGPDAGFTAQYRQVSYYNEQFDIEEGLAYVYYTCPYASGVEQESMCYMVQSDEQGWLPPHYTSHCMNQGYPDHECRCEWNHNYAEVDYVYAFEYITEEACPANSRAPFVNIYGVTYDTHSVGAVDSNYAIESDATGDSYYFNLNYPVVLDGGTATAFECEDAGVCMYSESDSAFHALGDAKTVEFSVHPAGPYSGFTAKYTSNTRSAAKDTMVYYTCPQATLPADTGRCYMNKAEEKDWYLGECSSSTECMCNLENTDKAQYILEYTTQAACPMTE